jgi:hypothetical protein
MSKEIQLEAHAVASSSATAELTVKTYPQVLLTSADDLLQQGKYGIAVVVAHMACEVATERSLTEAFSKKSISYMEEPVLGFLNGYNLATEKNRKLYTALTGDEVQQQAFWQRFKDSATRRNAIMHKGLIVDLSQAQESINAARDLIAHLDK